MTRVHVKRNINVCCRHHERSADKSDDLRPQVVAADHAMEVDYLRVLVS